MPEEPTNIVHLTEEQKIALAAMTTKPSANPAPAPPPSNTSPLDTSKDDVAPPHTEVNKAVILAKATSHIIAIERNMENYRGKSDVNPYAWLREHNIEKLKKRISKGDVEAATVALRISAVEVPKIREFEYLEGEKVQTTIVKNQ